MPYSGREQAAWMREYRAEKKRLGESSLRERELEKRLQSISRLLVWQNRTILGLQKQVVGLRALLAVGSLPTDAALKQPLYDQQPTHKVLHERQDGRILQLEADLARFEAILSLERKARE